MRRPPEKKPIDEKVRQRLARLEWLIDSEYEGSAAAFERGTGIKMSQISQWFSGERALRDKALARLESATSKPDGWFDAHASSHFHGSHIIIGTGAGTGVDGGYSLHELKDQLVTTLGIDESRIAIRSGQAANALADALQSGAFSSSTGAPTLAQALEVVATKLNLLTDDQREMVAQRLQTLARAPDSQRAREAVLATLEPSAQESDAQQQATIAPELQEQARKRHQEALLQANNTPDDGKKRHSA